MDYRKGSIVLTLIFALIGLLAIFEGTKFPAGGRNDPGPAFFPILIAAIMVTVCAVVLIRSIASKPAEVEFNNKGAVLFAVVLTVLFLVLWEYFHQLFLVWVFLLACGMYCGFQKGKLRDIRVLSTALGIAAGVTFFVYIMFDILIQLNF